MSTWIPLTAIDQLADGSYERFEFDQVDVLVFVKVRTFTRSRIAVHMTIQASAVATMSMARLHVPATEPSSAFEQVKP